MAKIKRPAEQARLAELLKRYPAVGLVGARQVGKTTLARDYAASRGGASTYFDLESPRDLARLADPLPVLEGLRGLVVVDEVQLLPELFSIVRVLADRPKYPARFLLLGSASPDLLRQGSQTLAGRIHFHELKGLGLDEVGLPEARRLWLRGGFPRSFLARSAAASHEWRQDFIQTFLQRDLPQLGIAIPAPTMRRFWTMLAHYHGQVWNASEFGRSFGVADSTVRRYLDMLTAALVVRQLQPWHENVSKRQVKAPKTYLADSGILHALLNLPTLDDVEGHPKAGASWEGFALELVVRRLQARPEECYFWATHAGAELDLLVVRGRRRLGFEFKKSSAPRLTPSMRTALGDLKLTSLDVIYPGTHRFPLAPGVHALGLDRVLEDLRPL